MRWCVCEREMGGGSPTFGKSDWSEHKWVTQAWPIKLFYRDYPPHSYPEDKNCCSGLIHFQLQVSTGLGESNDLRKRMDSNREEMGLWKLVAWLPVSLRHFLLPSLCLRKSCCVSCYVHPRLLWWILVESFLLHPKNYDYILQGPWWQTRKTQNGELKMLPPRVWGIRSRLTVCAQGSGCGRSDITVAEREQTSYCCASDLTSLKPVPFQRKVTGTKVK